MEVLLDPTSLQGRVAELAGEVRRHSGPDPLLIGVLEGCGPFLRDLAHHLGPDVQTDTMAISTYGAGGRVRMVREPKVEVGGRSVVVVDAMVETGFTFSFVLAELRRRGATRLATAVVVDDAARRIVPVPVTFRVLDSGGTPVVGYGLGLRPAEAALPFLARAPSGAGDLPPAGSPQLAAR